MTARRRRLWIQALAVLVVLAFGASDSLARSGGGGRGGGRAEVRGGGGSARAAAHRGGGKSQSINKGGPASRGMGSASRAQRQPRASAKPRASGGGAGNRKLAAARAGDGKQKLAAKRPAAGTRPGTAGTRQGVGGAERPNAGERQDNRTERQGNRQEGRTDRTDIRQENRTHRQDNRQDFASEAREDRQDFWDDRIEDVDWNEVDWDHWEVWEDDDFEWGLGTWMTIAVGTAVTAAAWNSMQQQSNCNLQQVEVNDRAYMKCGNTWYIEAWSGENVHYVAVDPPVGY